MARFQIFANGNTCYIDLDFSNAIYDKTLQKFFDSQKATEIFHFTGFDDSESKSVKRFATCDESCDKVGAILPYSGKTQYLKIWCYTHLTQLIQVDKLLN